jgi:maltose/moltooligosaccharide transporter
MNEEIESKPRMNFAQLWNMNFGFLGIQFGWGLQMANMSAIYTKLGADPDKIPILSLAGAVTGLLVQPIIGAMSDRTWNRFGRRRPYFATGAVLASIILFFMPSSYALWVAACFLWILDASINVSMEPFRAFVADKLPISQRASGFLMQSFFIGLGATLANVLPYLLNHFGVTSEAVNGVPLSVLYSFRIGAIVMTAAVLWTVFRTPEDPPTAEAESKIARGDGRGAFATLREIIGAIRVMPLTMRQLAIVQFATWFGLACMWAFFTLTVARRAFGAYNSHTAAFDRATEWAGVCFAVYSIVCFLAAPLLPILSERLGRAHLHAVCLACGAVGIISVGFIHNQYLFLLPMVGFGIAWASILAMPYAILSVALPADRMGVYMGIFNLFIVLPQMAASLLLQPVVKYIFGNDPAKVVVMGGFFLALAVLATLRLAQQSKDEALGLTEIDASLIRDESRLSEAKLS